MTDGAPRAGLALSVLALAATSCGAGALPHGASADACGSCHAAQKADWSVTAHARSAASPVFLALLPRVEAAWGPAAKARCVACHAPGFGGDDGIGCVACHGAVGNRGARDGALVVSVDAPLAGPRALSNAAHRVEPRPLLRSAQLCATCHEVTGPTLLDEPTHTEFAATRFAAADDCVGCHVDTRGGTHRLVGVDPPWGLGPVEAAQASERSRALWAKALSLSVEEGPAGLQVRLENTGAGHAVPTGATHLRDVWVDVEVVDARGERVEVPRALSLGAELSRGGQPVALVTDADRVTPRGLAFSEARVVPVEGPPGAARPLRVTARLWARAVRPEGLDALGLGARADEVPALPVAVAEAWAR